MFSHKRFSFIVTGAFVVLCLGIGCAGVVHARQAEPALEERTGRPVAEVQSRPQETAKAIVADYMEGIKALGDSEGAPLTGYTITDVDTTDMNNVTVTVIPAYVLSGTTSEELPATDYHLVKVDGQYQVKQQSCVYDMNPTSPGFKTVRCFFNWSVGKDGSIGILMP